MQANEMLCVGLVVSGHRNLKRRPVQVCGVRANYYAYGPPIYYGAVIGIAGLAIIVFWKKMNGEGLGALLVLGGAILSGFALFETVILNNEFSLRCFEDVGCSVAYARSSMFDAHVLGFLLAIGTFLLGYGLSFSGTREESEEKSRLD
jgi:hypothetical protein